VHEDALQYICVAAQMRPAHAAGVIGVGEAAFDPFTATSQESLASFAADAAAIGVDRVTRLRLIDP
jgi:hypothetical protein